MIYRNIHSGKIIEIQSVLISPDWERIEEKAAETKTEEKKSNGRKSIRKSK